MAQTHQLSKSALDRLTAEHADLTTRARIEIANLIERAREMGDLKENGDYHAAKDQQGMQEARVRQLESILENAEIVEGTEAGVAGVGTIVTIVYEGDDDDMAETYLIGHMEEKSGSIDVVSPGSPLGSALIGVHEGNTVGYAAPNGELRVTVKKVVPA